MSEHLRERLERGPGRWAVTLHEQSSRSGSEPWLKVEVTYQGSEQDNERGAVAYARELLDEFLEAGSQPPATPPVVNPPLL